jgi:hypothetical protein
MTILVNARAGAMTCALALAIFTLATPAAASSWNGIEPFKTRRAEVIKILGEPVGESPDGVMRFAVMGGSVQVSFVSERFVAAKKLRTELAGTVLEIVLQHEHSSDTPESLKLMQNRSFTKDETQTSLIFRNLKEGVVYTFMQGNLRTTRYTFGDEQLGKARRY